MLIAEGPPSPPHERRDGKARPSASEVDVALGGALLVELTLMQRLDLAGPSEQVRKGHLVVRDASATSDQLLDEALAMVGEKQGKKPQNVVTALGKRVRVRLYNRLAGRGLLRAESGKVLGIFPSPRASNASQANARDTARYTRRKSTSAEDRSPAQMLRTSSGTRQA